MAQLRTSHNFPAFSRVLIALRTPVVTPRSIENALLRGKGRGIASDRLMHFSTGADGDSLFGITSRIAGAGLPYIF